MSVSKVLCLTAIAAGSLVGCASHSTQAHDSLVPTNAAPAGAHQLVSPKRLPGTNPAAGKRFASASQASAAGGGFYVPDCAGHGPYYLQPDGAVVTFISGTDAELWAYPPSGGYVARPITGNSVVTPRTLTAQGQVAYGYDATPRFVRVSATRVEGVALRSYLTWSNRGSSMHLSSAAQLPLGRLKSIADGCK